MSNNKSYLRYEHTNTFGVIASPNAGSLVQAKLQIKNEFGVCSLRTVAITPTLETVSIWDLRTGNLLKFLPGERAEVTFLEYHQGTASLAVGYANGSIKVWSMKTFEQTVTLWGHKSSISILKFDSKGLQLASGSYDTDVIIWDIVAETGLYRFKGHKGPITALYFMRRANCLISSSKDTLIRVWDLDIQHCIQTLVHQKSEVRAFFLDHDEAYLFAVTADTEIPIYEISAQTNEQRAASNLAVGQVNLHALVSTDAILDKTIQLENEQSLQALAFKYMGSHEKEAKGKPKSIYYNLRLNLLIIQTTEKAVEVYKVRTGQELLKKTKSRIKKLKAKAEKHGLEIDPLDLSESPKPREFLSHLHSFHAANRTFAMYVNPVPSTKKLPNGDITHTLDLMFGLKTNSLEVYALAFTENLSGFDANQKSAIELHGHRHEVRASALSEDDKLLLTCSNGHIKVWNIVSRVCIRTIESGYGVSCAFIHGGKFVIIGTKTGELQLFDITSGVLLENVQAHQSEIWSLTMDPNNKLQFFTGSADKTVKRWQFELIDVAVQEIDQEDEGEDHDNALKKVSGKNEETESKKKKKMAKQQALRTVKQLSFVNTAILKVSDDVLSVSISPNSVYLAASLLDHTVKLFYVDSLKYYLTLYGHKLPVLDMAMSYDSTKIVTVSADKNIKIWGLDFGNCQKSIFAHEDSITQVRFIPGTHHIFTASKDGTIKYWDSDKFIHILTLKGHHDSVWTLSVSRNGDYLVSGSADKSLRVWTRSDDLVYVNAERENELLDDFEDQLVDAADPTSSTNQQQHGVDPSLAEGDTSVGSASRTTLESIKSTENLIDALLLADEEEKKYEAYLQALRTYCKVNQLEYNVDAPPANPDTPRYTPNVLFTYYRAKTPSEYVLAVLSKVKMNNIQEAILTMTFAYCMVLCKYINEWVKKNKAIELASRCLFLILKIHQRALANNRLMVDTLSSLRVYTRKRLTTLKDVIGYNITGMKHLQSQLAYSNIMLYDEAEAELSSKALKKKRQNLHSV